MNKIINQKNEAMEKNKLINLIKEAWNDGLNSYHDCKHRHEFDTDLENFLDNSKDDINELCESQKPEASENTLSIADVNNCEAVVCDCVFKKGCMLCIIGRIKMSECDSYEKQTDL